MRDHFSTGDGITPLEQWKTQLTILVMREMSQKKVTSLLTMNTEMHDPCHLVDGITAAGQWETQPTRLVMRQVPQKHQHRL